jgi:hypothetical protein
MPFMHVHDAIQLIQMEYAEMPELKLTFHQAQRLWNLSTELCERSLTALMRSGFLAQTRDGSFVRRGDPPVTPEAIESLVRSM